MLSPSLYYKRLLAANVAATFGKAVKAHHQQQQQHHQQLQQQQLQLHPHHHGVGGHHHVAALHNAHGLHLQAVGHHHQHQLMGHHQQQQQQQQQPSTAGNRSAGACTSGDDDEDDDDGDDDDDDDDDCDDEDDDADSGGHHHKIGGVEVTIARDGTCVGDRVVIIIARSVGGRWGGGDVRWQPFWRDSQTTAVAATATDSAHVLFNFSLPTAPPATLQVQCHRVRANSAP